jgi:hypothetical protein
MKQREPIIYINRDNQDSGDQGENLVVLAAILLTCWSIFCIAIGYAWAYAAMG